MDDPYRKPLLFDRIGGRPMLEKLLRRFYADVRQHREIGPLFTSHITDWTAHLAQIADFWSGTLGGPAPYCGPMPAKHVPLGLEEKHFEAWLGLWERHCRAHLPAQEAGEVIFIAEAIGRRLRQIVATAPSSTHG